MGRRKSMPAWRLLGGLVGLLILVPASWAQSYPLAEAVQAGDCFQVQLDMKLTGEERIFKDGKMVPLKIEANASLAFPERVLVVGSNGLTEKVARIYETARAIITIEKDRSERTLRPQRRLVVAQRHKDQALTYSPAGAMQREEQALVGEHFDTLFLAGLLPGKAVAVGDTWKVTNGVAQAACAFEGLTRQDLTGKLEGVQGDTARFSLQGKAEGIEQGALVKLTVEATGQFDLKAKRLVSLEWKQKDERGQGPVSPAGTLETMTTLRRQPMDRPAGLSDESLVSVPSDFTPPVTMTNLELRDPKGRYAILHARDWQLTARADDHLVMRLVDRGDFIAQVTVTPWTAAEKGKHLSPEEFKTAMNNTSGWKPEQELQASEVPSGDQRWIYRLSVQGQLEGLAVLQNFYLVAAPTGEQVVVTFTLTPKQADKLGARDLSFVASMEVPAGK